MRGSRHRLRGLLLLALPAALALAALLFVRLRPRPSPGPDAQGAADPPAFVSGRIGGEGADLSFAPGAFDDPAVRGFSVLLAGPTSATDYARAREDGFAAARGALTIEGAGSSARFELTVPATALRLPVPAPGLTDFAPERLLLTWSPARAAAPVPTGVEPLRVDRNEPIPADLGAVLSFHPGRWRQPSFELFRWSLVPSVLIFDTASYEVQDRLFKRLAFFVEKKGYAGTIPDFDSIAGLHGFNAHDYRAEDLARFFAMASREAIPLLPEERRLEELLLGAGALRRSGTEIREGAGGVISISRSSSDELRARFVTHEALHGLYFSSGTFRAGVRRIWEGSSEELRQFIRLYLSWPDWSYDLDNTYLLLNEFMAYFLQYTEEEAQALLVEHGLDWLRERFPEREGWLERFGKTAPEEAARAYRGLEAELWRELGVGGGRLIALRPAR